jgi:hypothetical protein
MKTKSSCNIDWAVKGLLLNKYEMLRFNAMCAALRIKLIYTITRFGRGYIPVVRQTAE